MSTHCTRCGHGPNTQLSLVLDAALCPRCVAKFKVWARQRNGYVSRKDRVEQLAEIEATHGAITVRRVAIATGRSAPDALKLLNYLSKRGVVERIVRGKYRLPEHQRSAAE